MWILLALAIALSVGISQSGIVDAVKNESPEVTRAAAREVENYRTFVYAASQYMANAKPSRPAAGQIMRIEWDPDIRTAPWTPPAARDLGMPSGWRVELDPDGEYVICAQLQERTLAQLNAGSHQKIRAWGVSESANPYHRVVLGENRQDALKYGGRFCR